MHPVPAIVLIPRFEMKEHCDIFDIGYKPSAISR
jgi:hypothetical protein